MVEEMTEKGLRVRDIAARIDESKTFVLTVDRRFSADPIVLEVNCRWTASDDASEGLVAGFEIINVVQGDLKGLMAFVRTFPFGEALDA